MTQFQYKCPQCGTTNILHDIGCKYEHEELHQFEKCYIDIISVLIDHHAMMKKHDAVLNIKEEMLKKRVENSQEQNPWLKEHQDCLERLKSERHIVEEPKGLRLTEPEEREEQIIPTFEPLRTIYSHGPCDGAKDYSVFTMVSWCTLKELTWEQTCNFMKEWLRETGAWERCEWGEDSIQELLDDKRHVWRKDMGWGDYADAAKREIENHGPGPQINISEKHGAEASEYNDT